MALAPATLRRPVCADQTSAVGLDDLLDSLHPRMRRLLQLRALMGLSRAAVAARYRISERDVERWEQAALEALAAL